MARSFTIILALMTAAACRKESAKSVASGPTQLLAKTAFYQLEAAPQRCAAAPCELELRLTALGAYKVNEEYPFKFLPSRDSAPAVEGTPRFERRDGKHGVMTVRIARRDVTSLSGVFKLSVCTADTCEIAEPEISVALPTS